MKNHYLFHLFIWGAALLFSTGCQTKSGSIWDNNQTGAKYKHSSNTSSAWESDIYPKAHSVHPSEEEFLSLNESDLKGTFGNVTALAPQHDLGEGGVPTMDQFQTPQGTLASIFAPIFFDTDQHTVKGIEALESIRKMASYLKHHKKAYLVIQGYCDERGPEAYNLALGTRRANAVRSLLVKEGVHPDQLHTVSFGKEKPFALGHTPSDWAQNRRAHFLVHAQR